MVPKCPLCVTSRCDRQCGSGGTDGRTSIPSAPAWLVPCPSPPPRPVSASTASSSPRPSDEPGASCPTQRRPHVPPCVGPPARRGSRVLPAEGARTHCSCGKPYGSSCPASQDEAVGWDSQDAALSSPRLQCNLPGWQEESRGVARPSCLRPSQARCCLSHLCLVFVTEVSGHGDPLGTADGVNPLAWDTAQGRQKPLGRWRG